MRPIKKKIISDIIPLALILFSMLLPNLTHAGVYDQQQTSENGYAGSIYGTWKHAQSFKPGFNYADFTVQIYVRKEDPADAVSLQNLVMEIREDASGVPSSTILMSNTITASSIGTSYTWIEWFFTNTGKSLKLDQPYWIVCYQASDGGNSSNKYVWAENVGGDPYSLRGMAATHNGSIWTAYASDDYTFKTWAEQLVVPPAPTLVGPGSTNPATPTVVSANPNLDWNDVTGYYVDWYNLQHEKISTGTVTTIGSITVSNHAPSLVSGEKYAWRVAAHNNAGLGSYSGELYILTNPIFWSDDPAGTTPIPSRNDGDTAYMIANFSSTLAGRTATFNVYEVDRGIEISLEQYDGPIATTTATLDANGKAVASWIADWMQDGWGGVYDPPEYVFIAKVDNTSLESGELQIPNTPQKFIDKAIWSSTANGSTPITTATDGQTIYMYVETRGAVLGEEAIFKIEEKDQWPNPNDDVEVKTTTVANIYGTGKFSVPWVVDWQDDAPFNPPEFVFKITIDKNSRESAELSIPTGKADTYIDLDNKTVVAGVTVTLRGDLYEKVSLPIVGEWNKGINGKTITWYIDKNKDGDYLDANEYLTPDTTSGVGLYLDGTITKDLTATGLAAGNYPIKAVFAGDASYNASEGKATLTVNGDTVNGDYAAQIISISKSDFTVGKKTPITITVKNIGKAADLKIDPDNAPSGWDIDDNQIDSDKDEITINNVAQGATATFTYYITPPENEDKAYITWRLYKDETWPINDIPLEAVKQEVTAITGTPIPKLTSPLDGDTFTKPVILDWSNDWESYPSTDPNYINYYTLNLFEKYPYAWELVKAGDVQAGVDETTAHSGLKSIKSYIATASTSNEIVWKFKDYVEIAPSTQYTLSVWVKTSGAYSGGGSFKLSFYDKLYGSKVGTDVSLAIPSGDRNWTQYKTTFTSPATANYIGDLYFDYYNGKGYVWFDDVEIVKGAGVTKKNPETTITSGPEGATPDKNVTFTYSGTDPDGQVTNFSYGLQGPGYDGTFIEVPATTTSVTYNNLADGDYIFVVRAKDNDLNYDPTPANRMFTVGYTTEPNLVPNPGFESGTTSPTSWVLTTSGNSQGLWDNTTYHSGTRSVKSRLIDNPVEWKATQNITVNPTSFYRMSLWVKKSGSAEGKFFMQLEIQDAANASLGAITLPIPIGDSDWIRYVKAIKLPANSDHIASISLKASEGAGILWFDDLAIQEISAAEAISAPAAEITSGPENNSIVTTKDVTFKWSGTDSDGTIQGFIYSLDKAISNQDWFPLTTDTTATFNNLSAGKHTFYVTAVDNSGFDDPTPETRTFTINNPPQTTITTGPSGNVSSGNVTFNWTGTDPDTGDTISGYSYRLVGTTTDSGWFTWTTSTTKSYSGLSGSYTFYVKAKDSVGAEDPSSASSSFDVNSAPTITTYSPASLTPSVNEGTGLSFSATASDPDGDVLSYQWTVDGVAKSNNSIWTFTPTDNDVGTRNVTLTVSDGRLSATKTWTVTVNDINNAPVIMSYSPPTTPQPVVTVDYTLVFSVIANDPDGDLLTYSWKLDGAEKSTNTSWTYRPTSSEVGTHNVTVTVSDGLLNTTKTWTVTVNSLNSPPNTPSNPSPPNGAIGINVNADLSWTGGDPDAGDTVTYDVYFGTSATPPLVSTAQSGASYDPGTMTANTTYYWYIIAKDNHGAESRGPASGNWSFTTGVTGTVSDNAIFFGTEF